MLGNLFRISTNHKRSVRKKRFQSRVNKKQNVDIDNAASTGGQGKLTYFMYFSWSPVQAALSVFNFEQGLVNIKGIIINA